MVAALLASPITQARTGQEAPVRPAAKADSTSSTQGREPASTQNGRGQAEDVTVLKEYTDVVTFNVTVTDTNNRLVAGLSRDHFELYEDNVKQTLEYFRDIDAPASIGILFDVSGSMKGKIDRALEALRAFIETSHVEDDYFLIAFNHRANLVAEFTDGDTILNKLTLVTPKGETALYDAAYLGCEKVKQGRHRKRVLLLISDGEDNRSRYSYGELHQLLRESDVQVYCVGISGGDGFSYGYLGMQGQAILEEIAKMSGGKAFFPQSEQELEDATTRIALELRHQYSLGYVPTNLKRDGKFHKIKVRINLPRGLPSLRVQTREGYYAASR
ncbi:MAG: VWA domain-containing protein [Acidobacteriales bacterium]|nr:VWA domain-containing protein [Terriglobales bacterium]